MNSRILFKFTVSSNLQNWEIVDDIVMGGKSSSTISLNTEGFGVFKGNVSLENNGGFSLVRYQFETIAVANYSKVVIKLRGDGKSYQFRLKASREDYFNYIYNFETSGNWQEIVIPLKDMHPMFRGKPLDKPNFAEKYIETLGFLIANKKAENFNLEIDAIELR